MNKDSYTELQPILQYEFKNSQILSNALTHSSYANENKKMKLLSNERLEFLGDSILSFVISAYIFDNYPKLPEGEMTKIRASVVCEQTLKDISNQLGIGEYLKLGKGEELTGGRKRPSILADVFEAIVGGIYIDNGLESAKKFVLDKLEGLVIDAVKGVGMIDYKTTLQEELQKHGDVKITYEVIKESGPDHDKEFKVQIKCNDKVLGIGLGKSKKEAEQAAAAKALQEVQGNE
ncbi:MAG: ribonuclease III [Deltaproteobacteria bacterium]